jgi:hypothetical protein
VEPAKVSKIVREIPEGIVKPDYWRTGHPMVQLEAKVVERKSEEAIRKMRKSCQLAKAVLNAAANKVKVSTFTWI